MQNNNGLFPLKIRIYFWLVSTRVECTLSLHKRFGPACNPLENGHLFRLRFFTEKEGEKNKKCPLISRFIWSFRAPIYQDQPRLYLDIAKEVQIIPMVIA